MLKEISAGGVVSRSGKLLLVRVCNLEKRKVWTFPKGHLERGETALAAALREVEEETGWRCRKVRGLPAARYRFRRKGRPVSKVVRWYWMRPVEKTGRPDAEEILACRWLSPARARALLRYPSDLALIENWSAAAKDGAHGG